MQHVIGELCFAFNKWGFLLKLSLDLWSTGSLFHISLVPGWHSSPAPLAFEQVWGKLTAPNANRFGVFNRRIPAEFLDGATLHIFTLTHQLQNNLHLTFYQSPPFLSTLSLVSHQSLEPKSRTFFIVLLPSPHRFSDPLFFCSIWALPSSELSNPTNICHVWFVLSLILPPGSLSIDFNGL